MEEEVSKCRPEDTVLMSLIPRLCHCMAASVRCPAINCISCPPRGPVQAQSRAFLADGLGFLRVETEAQEGPSRIGTWSRRRAGALPVLTPRPGSQEAFPGPTVLPGLLIMAS